MYLCENNIGQTELFLEIYDPEIRGNIKLRSRKVHINPTNKVISELEELQQNGYIKFWINDNINWNNKPIEEVEDTNEFKNE